MAPVSGPFFWHPSHPPLFLKGKFVPLSKERVQARLTEHLFKARLLDNSFRGFWCEAMVAEALGPKCQIVGEGWFPWDLQIGSPTASFPDRIRIQVKNSAALQPWNSKEQKETDCIFNLSFRRQPDYVMFDEHEIPCEKVGFMCDIFILCHHPETDPKTADHKAPEQWRFYVLPVLGPNIAITNNEFKDLKHKLETGATRATTQRRPTTMRKGIRGRQPIYPVEIKDLTTQLIRSTLGIK